MHPEKIKLPTQTGRATVSVKKVRSDEVRLVLTGSGVEFDVPREIVPANVVEGDQLSLQLISEETATEQHTVFAQRLLEEIIN